MDSVIRPSHRKTSINATLIAMRVRSADTVTAETLVCVVTFRRHEQTSAAPTDVVVRQQSTSEFTSAATCRFKCLAARVRLTAASYEHAKHIKSWQKAPPQHWYDVAIGSSQAHITLTVHSRLKRVAAEIYINDNKELYNELHDNKSEIEDKLGFALDWQELPAKKASRIIVTRAGDFLDEQLAQELVMWLVQTADKFAGVFPNYF